MKLFLIVKQGFPILSVTKTLYLISDVVYKFQCSLCNESYYGKSIRHLDIRSGEHIYVSPLTEEKVKPSNNSSVCDHLLHSIFLPSFNNFSILAHENKKCLSEIKESLLIMRDKPSLNRNINSAPLHHLIKSTNKF